MSGPLTSQLGFVISRASDGAGPEPYCYGTRLQAVQVARLPISNEGGVSNHQPVGASAFATRRHEPGSAGLEDRLTFREYLLIPTARLLLRDGQPVKVGSRAFDLLQVLLSARGSLVSKETIVNHVWPDTIVEESNLRFQMGCLRKALGNDRDLIITIPGRGYLFAADLPAGLVHSDAADAQPADAAFANA